LRRASRPARNYLEYKTPTGGTACRDSSS
jgi:hypothetical protein